MMSVFAIVEGYKNPIIQGIYPINKNSFASYVKDIGQVLAEENERIRIKRKEGSTSKWKNFQFDKFQIGKRK